MLFMTNPFHCILPARQGLLRLTLPLPLFASALMGSCFVVWQSMEIRKFHSKLFSVRRKH